MKTEQRYLELSNIEFSVLFLAVDGSIERWQEVKENPSLEEGCPDLLSPDLVLKVLDSIRKKIEDLL